jgi:hypothetical protein
MRYLLLIYTDHETSESMTPADREAMYREYYAFTKEIADTGQLLGGEPLQGIETATTVRVRGGKTATTDGPFAETKEVLGGYFMVDCKDLDRAIEVAARIPGAAIGSIEVRPILERAEMPAG